MTASELTPLTKLSIVEGQNTRRVFSDNYNSYFNKESGFFARWGKTEDDDPVSAPMPEIADIEISSGMCHNNCPFCYKGNCKTGRLHNMTFDEFKNIFHKLTKTVAVVKYNNGFPDVLIRITGDKNVNSKEDAIKKIKDTFNDTSVIESIKIRNTGLLQQIAFGITAPNDNPDFFNMMKYAREFDVIPNYTCNGSDMTEDIAQKSVGLCGAIALSANDIDKTYNAIQTLHSLGMKQTNIHAVAFNGSYDKIMRIISDKKTDSRLEGLNALVLLKYKPKGTNAGKFTCLTQEQYKEIFDYARENGVGLGFDSCSCHNYLTAIKDDKNFENLSKCAEPCESTLFSIYINSHCEVFPCSFCENEKRDVEGKNWTQGLNLLQVDKLEDIWQSKEIQNFRELLLKNSRRCPMFEV